MMTLDDTPTTATRQRIRLIGALIGAAAAASIALPAAADARPVAVPNELAPTSAKQAPVTSSTPVLRRDGSKAAPSSPTWSRRGPPSATSIGAMRESAPARRSCSR
jgi:CTP:molybdopterin cytidylyltransferase MocA